MFRRLKKYLRRFSLFKAQTVITESKPRIGINTEIHDCDISPLTSVGKNCYLYKTSLGAFTYLSQNVNIMNSAIGKFCSIGQGVCISTGMHPSSTFVSTHPAFFSLHKQSGATFAKESHFREMGHTTIGNDVWIGTNAIIMDDLTIGDGAIIGAGAIVTKDVLPYSIVVGNPAKHLRFRFEKDEIDFLLAFKWWTKDLAWIEENYIQFHDIKSFMKNNSGNH
jgi:acetyltransferase-like isoleucine patch superfamily enzyme